MCMRTNIELSDDLMAEARTYSKARTKRGLIEEALEAFIRQKAEERRLATYAGRLNAVREKMAGRRFRESPAEILRKDRSR